MLEGGRHIVTQLLVLKGCAAKRGGGRRQRQWVSVAGLVLVVLLRADEKEVEDQRHRLLQLVRREHIS